MIGVGEAEFFLASDVNAFAKYTRRAVFLNDGEYAILQSTRICHQIFGYASNAAAPSRDYSVGCWQCCLIKGPYPHFMLKEIHEGARLCRDRFGIPGVEIMALAQRIQDSQQTFLTGVGTAYYVALLAQYYFATYADCYIPAVSADEFPTLGKVTLAA